MRKITITRLYIFAEFNTRVLGTCLKRHLSCVITVWKLVINRRRTLNRATLIYTMAVVLGEGQDILRCTLMY